MGVLDTLAEREKPVWAFAIGVGCLGWLVMPLALVGWLNEAAFIGLELFMAAGCFLVLRRFSVSLRGLGSVELVLIGALALAFVFDVVEALAPPVDADTLAYHFARPRQILRDGRIDLLPRAVDGVLPLLLHMTYLPPLKLGGESALTLWAMLSGAAPAALLYVIVRRWLSRTWALASALVLVTTPAWIYGAGAGQVETRIALFVLPAALAVAQSLRAGSAAYAAVAGTGAGFYAASKYLGLIYVLSCGLLVLWQRRWLQIGAAYALAAIFAGGPWYLWNFIYTGDPIFPALFAWLPPLDPHVWNAEIDGFFRTVYLPTEQPVPANFFWLIVYPFQATFAGWPIWESGRTGLGPIGILLLPFAAAGAWRFRHSLTKSPLTVVAIIGAVFYVIWFFVGMSQRVRHLVPIFPLLLLCVFVSAQRWGAAAGGRGPLAAALVVTIVLQLSAHGIFSMSYMRRLWIGETREQFLSRNVANYAVVPWLNSELSQSHRLLMAERQLIYLLDFPLIYAPAAFQAQVDLRDNAMDVPGQWRDVRRLGVTHILLIPGLTDSGESQALWRLGHTALAMGCAALADRRGVAFSVSRTLPTLHQVRSTADVLRVRPDPCALDRS